MKSISSLSSKHAHTLLRTRQSGDTPALMEIRLYSGGREIGLWVAHPEKIFYHTDSSTVEFLDEKTGQCCVISGTFIIRSRLTAKDMIRSNNDNK